MSARISLHEGAHVRPSTQLRQLLAQPGCVQGGYDPLSDITQSRGLGNAWKIDVTHFTGPTSHSRDSIVLHSSSSCRHPSKDRGRCTTKSSMTISSIRVTATLFSIAIATSFTRSPPRRRLKASARLGGRSDGQTVRLPPWIIMSRTFRR